MQRALANQAFRSITRSSSLLAHPGMSELASIWTPAARSILGSCPYTPKFPVRRRHDCHSPRDTGQNRTKEKQEESKPPKRPLFERAKRGWFTAGEVLITILLVLGMGDS